MGHLIPHDHTLGCTGDASKFALGTYSHEMRFWFVMYFNDDQKALIASNKVHINGLKFATILLQLVAYIVFFDTPNLKAEFETQHHLPMEPVTASMEIKSDPDLVPKNFGVIYSHWIHWFIFCIKMNHTDNLVLEKVSPVEPSANWQCMLCT